MKLTSVRALGRAAAAVALSVASAGYVSAAEPVGTPVKLDQLDPAAFAEWSDGAERPIVPADAKDNDRKPQWVIWTADKATPGHAGLAFGQSKQAGPRHLRVGFKSAVPVGAILVRGGVTISVLKPDAAYPGDVADDAQWVPAERLKNGSASRDEAGRDAYFVWTLPAVTSTRAIRFSHTAEVTDKEYAGWLGAAYVLPTRVTNVAPAAAPAVSVDDRNAGRLVNESTDPGWDQWASLPNNGGDRAKPVSADDPEWAALVWPKDVKLSGLGVAFAGFAAADVEVYAGPADIHPREAPASAWKPVGKFADLKSKYPVPLSIDWVDFGQTVATRAVRLKITQPLSGNMHQHVQRLPRDGKRVWAGELIALSPLADGADLKTAAPPPAAAVEQPPIAVKFTLPEAGWVTLVIEDSTGKRVRNLVSDTFFEKGENTAWWDGSDDLGRDPSAAKHGLYYIPTQFVAPGTYRVRGLWRKKVDAKYEFGVYTAGSTPWNTEDRTGAWLSNHTPPSGVLFVPDVPTPDGKTKASMLIGSYVSEGTAGLAWVDLDGNKWRGQNWVGGNWTGAPYLARDAGPKAIAGNYAYVAAAWSAGDNKAKPPKGEIRLTALTAKEDKTIIKFPFDPKPVGDGDSLWTAQIGGVAVHNGIAVISMPAAGKLLLVDVAAGKVVGEQAVEKPHGVAFDVQGRLHVLSGTKLLRYPSVGATLPPAEVVIDKGLEDPVGITIAERGAVFISDRGTSHQVKVFDATGKQTRAIGKGGEPKTSLYDKLHMNNPRGLALDSRDFLWVAEEDYQPKRVSVWHANGSLRTAYYGPTEYGGGGSVDPKDKTKFYYYGMEFRLDWDKGTNELSSVYYRNAHGQENAKLPNRSGLPQSAIYANGKRYWTNAFNSNPTGGHSSAIIFADRDGLAVPAAAAGRANHWELLRKPEFASVWPEGTDSKQDARPEKSGFFFWSDANADGTPQPAEVRIVQANGNGVIVMDDLSFAVARFNGQAVRFAPASFSAAGVPAYDPEAMKVVVEGAGNPPSSGGDQLLVGPNGWAVHTNAPKPFSPAGLGGSKDGVPVWSYPSLWPGLHASHEAPVPDRPGMIVGHTRLLGSFINPTGNEPMWLINANDGPMHVFTLDGLYVAQLFHDMRVGRPWKMPVAQRGMVLNDLTPSDENFWPTVTQAADGKVYLVSGGTNSVVCLDGLETVKRIPATDLTITGDDLNRARDHFAKAEAARQAAKGRSTLTVQLRKAAPKVDGKLDEWATADWADIDRRGSRAYFNSDSKPYDVTGAVAVAGDRLYAAWRTNDKALLTNAGDVQDAPFKTGGALDLMIGTSDPSAADKRMNPVSGDVRLLVTKVNGKVRALVYRPAVAAGEAKKPVPFASPWRTITFDRVDDVSDVVELAADAEGNYEVSIPLAALGLKPAAGGSVRGDVGILRGTGSTTTQRVYWSNKATAIVADVPSEAELRPGLWGKWEFKE